jgi:hypothetical protein
LSVALLFLEPPWRPVRDAGAWIMFSGTPYAYLHICGNPWEGAEYSAGDEAVWTMRYSKPRPITP